MTEKIISKYDIRKLYMELIGKRCDEDTLNRLISRNFSLKRIKRYILSTEDYIEKKSTIFNFEKWVEFGYKYTYLVKDKNFADPPLYDDNNLVFIDFRYLENMEFVIRNALIRMEGKFMVTFVCGIENYDDIKILCKEISKNINVLKLNQNIENQSEYNKLLLQPDFWEKLRGNNILLHQFDAFIFKNWNDDFLKENYLGSPCYIRNKKLIINGGFSFRKKDKMIELLKIHKPLRVFEDIFLTKHTEIDENMCKEFAFQQKEFDSFGAHQFWKAVKYEFSEMYKKIQNFEEYNKKIIIIHCGNLDILEELMIKFPILKYCKCLITYYEDYYKDILHEKFKTNALHIMKVKNKGCDCGPFLLCLKYLLDNPELYGTDTIFLKIHTKSIADWRDKLIKDIIKVEKIGTDIPVLFGSDKYCYDNNKLVNSKYVYDIISRNQENKVNLISDFCDIYHNDKVSNNHKNNIFQDLDFNLNFYKNYEPDLKWVKDSDHWKIHGCKEFHRISNVNYIKSFSKFYNKFIAGTIFGFNKKYLNLFKDYNLLYEYELLEDGYIRNNKITKIHTWEYIFSLINNINNGCIKTFENNTEKNTFDQICVKPKINTFSSINVPFLSSKKAIFLIIPGNKADSGGYRTLLKYIFEINKTESMDIYFGICWNDHEVSQNVTIENNYGVPVCSNWNSITLDEILSRISNYNEIDLTKNNFYLGFKCQRNYETIYANAWQTAEAVYLNKNRAKKLIYYIQDREELFYPNNKDLQQNVLKTYKQEFEYHCITKYLENYFKNVYKLPKVLGFRMTADTSVYFNKNQKREKSVAIPYYKNIKPARLPRLVEQCIEKFSNEDYKCYVFPFNYSRGNKNVINIENQTVTQLNDLYNKCKYGIIFSTSNPSRLGFEMYESGLKVIEYDCEFTKYDMPDDKFFKIKKIEDINKII